jgi:site-specific DNA-methyltransferase (adenine-specific)
VPVLRSNRHALVFLTVKHVAAFSSASEEWHTPPALFRDLNAEFGFTLDAAATAENALCQMFLARGEKDALAPTQRWEGVVYCNPPYGDQIGRWVRKGFREAQRGSTVVMLLPARTDAAWWHEYVMKADEVRLIRGRLRFGAGVKTNPASHNATFPSCVVVFKSGERVARFSPMERPENQLRLCG